MWDEGNQATTDGIDQQLATIAEKYPEIADEIFLANGQVIDAMGEAGDAAKKQNQEILRNAKEVSGQLAESAEENAQLISWAANEATHSGQVWNSIVLDEKTGEVKTNVREAMLEAGESSEKWNNMRFHLHDANLDSNAKSIMGEVALTHGWWDGMSLGDKSLILQDEFTQTIYKSLEETGKWNEMTLEEQTAIVYSNTPEKMTETLMYLSLWDEYQPEIKEVQADNYDFLNTIRQSEEMINFWQEMEPETKELLGENYDLLTAIFESEERYKAFKGIPDEEKKLLAENVDLLNKVTQSETAYNRWNGLPEKEKLLIANNVDALGDIITSEETYNRWMQLPVEEKRILGNNTDLISKVISSEENYKEWLGLPDSEKRIRATTNVPSIASESKRAMDSVPDLKYAEIRATTNASSVASAAQRAINTVRGKTVTITTNHVRKDIGPYPTRATGDPSFQGGSVWLGDGGRREPYLTPSGRFGVSENDWQLHDLPKGTRIWPSTQSFKTAARYSDLLKQYLNHIPKFATGGTIENPYDGYTGLVSEAGPEIFQIAQGKVSITPITQGQRTRVLESQGANNEGSNQEILKSLLGQNNKLIDAIAQGHVVEMDGREVGRLVYHHIDEMGGKKIRWKQRGLAGR